MSTERNLLLLERAKEAGYFIRGVFVFTRDPQVNVMRVSSREQNGGHGVPEEKIVSRYHKSIALLPRFVEVCDVCHVYDNTQMPYRVFKKRGSEYFFWPCDKWTVQDIERLTVTVST